MFELAGGGQDNIGVARGLREKQVMDDCEEIFALQAFDNFPGVGGGGGGIGVINVERIDWRICLTDQDRAKTIHIEYAWSRRAGEIVLMSHRFAIPAQPVAGTVH